MKRRSKPPGRIHRKRLPCLPPAPMTSPRQTLLVGTASGALVLLLATVLSRSKMRRMRKREQATRASAAAEKLRAESAEARVRELEKQLGKELGRLKTAHERNHADVLRGINEIKAAAAMSAAAGVTARRAERRAESPDRRAESPDRRAESPDRRAAEAEQRTAAEQPAASAPAATSTGKGKAVVLPSQRLAPVEEGSSDDEEGSPAIRKRSVLDAPERASRRIDPLRMAALKAESESPDTISSMLPSKGLAAPGLGKIPPFRRPAKAMSAPSTPSGSSDPGVRGRGAPTTSDSASFKRRANLDRLEKLSDLTDVANGKYPSAPIRRPGEQKRWMSTVW